MATYTSSNVANRAPVASHGEAAVIQSARAVVSCTAAPTTTDTLNFFDLPANARVVGGYLAADDMDTNGTPTLTLNVGDAGDNDRYFAASNVGQTGAKTTTLAATGLDFKTTAVTRVTGAAQANAATGAAGTVTVCLLYVVED